MAHEKEGNKAAASAQYTGDPAQTEGRRRAFWPGKKKRGKEGDLLLR